MVRVAGGQSLWKLLRSLWAHRSDGVCCVMLCFIHVSSGCSLVAVVAGPRLWSLEQPLLSSPSGVRRSRALRP
eukprot:4343310-Alexandrium_andersonii.AAC.1